MPENINARRIVKKYHGTTQTYSDLTGRWIDLPLASGVEGNIQYLASDGIITLRGTFLTNGLYASTNNHPPINFLTIPDEFKNPILKRHFNKNQGYPIIDDTTYNNYSNLTLYQSGSVIQGICYSLNNWNLDASLIYFTYTK